MQDMFNLFQTKDRMEFEANAFALCLLISKDYLIPVLKRYDGTPVFLYDKKRGAREIFVDDRIKSIQKF